MTKSRPIWTDSAVVAAIFAVIALGLWGAHFALAVAISGALAVGNLALMHWVTDRLVRSIAAGKNPAGAALVLMAKMGLVLGAVAVLAQLFPGEAIAMGVAAAVMGLSVRPMVDMLTAPDDELPERSAP